jgi:arylsulfatase A-like enzyme
MGRRRRLTFLGPVSHADLAAGSSRRRRPNILMVLTDDLNLDEVSKMPHVRELVGAHGVTFTHAFVSVSLCCPSRSTILRGQYSHNTGVLANGGSNGGFEAAYGRGIEQSTIATWLQDAGYRTGLFGKYLNGYPATASDTYVPPGWSDFQSPTVGGNPYTEYNYVLNVNGVEVPYGSRPRDYGTTVYTRGANTLIKDAHRAHRPFFAYLSLYAPHMPAVPAPQDRGKFANARAPRTPSYNERRVGDKPHWVQITPMMSPELRAHVDDLYRRRIRSLQAVDRAVAGLVRTLKETRQLDDTYIVFASDNGFHLGQHRLPAGKQTPYDEDIRVPLMVRGPGVASGATRRAFVSNVDFAPTFAQLAGVRTPSFVDGRSFAPLLRSHPHVTLASRRAMLIEHWREVGRLDTPERRRVSLEPADRDEMSSLDGVPFRLLPRRLRLETVRGAIAALDRIPEYHGLRTARYTYVEYETGERELYDLSRDPSELNNIALTTPRPMLRKLHRRLRALERCSGAACRRLDRLPVPGD